MIANVFDLETTGKLKKGHRIIELSVRQCDLKTLTEKFNSLYRFNPERNIDAAALAVHKIPLAELEHEPTFKDKASEVLDLLLSADINVAHNGLYFDYPYLIQEFETVGIELPKLNIYDTMIKGNFATDLGKNPSLKELCFSLDVDYDDSLAHKGDYDTLILRDALFNGIKYGWFKIEGL